MSTGQGPVVVFTDHIQQEKLPVHPELDKAPTYAKCKRRSQLGRKTSLTHQVHRSPSSRRSLNRRNRCSKHFSTTSLPPHFSPANAFKQLYPSPY